MILQDFAFIFMGLLILIILYILIGKYLEHKHIHIIHETGIGILIGLLFGLLMFFTKNIKDLNFNQQIFFYGLLPPMIFAGGYNLKKEDFERNFKYIFLFGFFGTIVAFGVIFGLTYMVDTLQWILPIGEPVPYEYMQMDLIVKYSATISATDSVAALTLINPAQYPKLFSIIFGEGMVNDAVAIILFKVVGDIVTEITSHHSDMSGGEIALQIGGKLLLTIVASLGIGVFCALLCSFLFKNLRFLVQNEVTQVVITYLFGILSYVIAQTLDMSGVITVLVCGIVLAHYNYYNLTPGGMHATTVSFQFIAFLAQAVVFVYLGLSIVFYFSNEVFSITFIAAEIVICIIARFTAIFGMAMVCKLFMNWKVANNQLVVITASGTIRGSVALALILTIQSEQGTQNKVSIIKSTVLIMVCLTTIILGGVMPKLISYFMGSKAAEPEPLPLQAQAQQTQEIQNQDQKKKERKLNSFENKYMKKWLIYDYENSKEAFKMYKKIIKSNNSDESKKESNKMFVLRDLKLRPFDKEGSGSSLSQNRKQSLMSSGLH